MVELDDLRLASGCGKARVLDHGIVNIRWTCTLSNQYGLMKLEEELRDVHKIGYSCKTWDDGRVFSSRTNRTTKCLRTMHMSKARWIGNNCISGERNTRLQIRFDARLPTPVKHFRDHFSLQLNITSYHTLHARNQSRILNHISH